MSLKERLLSGETIGPEDGFKKTSLTSMVSQIRKAGYEVESLGDYRYRLVSEATNGDSEWDGVPPLPGTTITLELKVTELRLNDQERVVIKATDTWGHELEFVC